MMKTKEPLNNDELIISLKEIEEDAIVSRGLDEYEAEELSKESHISCFLGN